MTLTTLALPPSADLSSLGTAPLPIDDVGYLAPRPVAYDTAAYLDGDAAADAAQPAALTLPSLAQAEADDIVLEGVTAVDYQDYTTSTRTITLPATIAADWLIVVQSSYWTDATANAPAVPTDFTRRLSNKNSGTYDPRLTIDYKVADGDEGGTAVTVELDASHPVTIVATVWSGVDPTNPWDQTDAGPVYATGLNPDPPSITTVTDGAVVLATFCHQDAPSTGTASMPSSYTQAFDTTELYSTRRGMALGYRTIASAGAEDPGAYTTDTSQYTNASTLALRPASVAPDRTLVVIASSADETASSALVGSDCVLDGRDEIQTITSTLPSGTFTITLDGQTTAAIAFDATAAAIQSALEALSNVSVGDLRCDGGPLNSADVNVEFDAGWGDQDVPLMSTSSGSVVVSESVRGYAPENFGLAGDINVPRDGGSMEPQSFVWYLTPTDGYLAGRTISFDVSDHDGLKTWSAVLLVLADCDSTTPIEGFGTEATGTGSVADAGPVTPSTRAARALVAVAKARASGNYSTPYSASTPARTASVASAVADSMSLDLFMTAPLNDSEIDLATSSWSGSELFAVGVMSVKPASPPSPSLEVADVIAPEDVDSWAELAATAGDLYDVVEFDASPLPPDAWIVGASVRFAHTADAAHKLRAIPCGITTGGDVVLAEEATTGHAPVPLGSTVEVTTTRSDELVDGTTLNDYPRLGVAFRSSAGAAALSYHRLYWAELVLDVLTGGPVTSTVAGPSSPGDPITWAYSSAGGHPQTHYQVMVIQGSAQDPTAAVVGNPWGGATGDIVYDSGMVADTDARELTIVDHPLSSGTCTVAVRTWARLSGSLVPSDWVTADFDITGSAPTAPTVDSNATYDADTGTVEVGITTPSDATRIFLHRSTDGGSTFELAGAPVVVGASSTGTVVDPDPPLLTDTLYRIGCDSGDMTESNWAHEGAPTARNFTPSAWVLQVPADPTLNIPIDVVARSFRRVRPRRSVTAVGPESAVTLSSPELASRFSMTIRATSKSERDAIDVILARTDALRLVTILGRAWDVEVVGDIAEDMQRWMPLPSEATALRDSHELAVTLQEVT